MIDNGRCSGELGITKVKTRYQRLDSKLRTENECILNSEPRTDEGGKGRTGVLGGNIMLWRFFPRGEGSAWVLFSAGENLYWYTFTGGDSIPGRFFPGEVLCGGKLYATTPGLRTRSNQLRYSTRSETPIILAFYDTHGNTERRILLTPS